MAVYRLKANGSPDPSFDTDGAAGIDSGGGEVANALAIQPDGKIVVAGYSSNGATGNDAAVYRLNANGSPDPSFDTDGAPGKSTAAGTSSPRRLRSSPTARSSSPGPRRVARRSTRPSTG